MFRRIMHHQAPKPLAIRVNGRLRSVPPMSPDTDSDTRVKVFELVLRGLYGEAHLLATETFGG